MAVVDSISGAVGMSQPPCFGLLTMRCTGDSL